MRFIRSVLAKLLAGLSPRTRTAGMGSAAMTKAEEQALEWFIRQHSGAAMLVDEIEHFNLWVRQDRTHLLAYQRLVEQWEWLGSFSERPEIKTARERVRNTGIDLPRAANKISSSG